MSNQLMLCNQNRFSSGSDMLARPAPPSTMVFQQLVQALAAINQKVDALALRQQQSSAPVAPPRDNVVVRRVQRPSVEVFEPMASAPSMPRPRSRFRIDRNILMDIFE